MKKRNVKNLKLNKQTITNLDSSQMKVYGGNNPLCTKKRRVGPCAPTGNCNTQEARATYCECQSIDEHCPGLSDVCLSFPPTNCNDGVCW
ncbi:MAG: hypothetical protein GY757_43975 [bacterium]|nr:hypothetical protein [bacterium]